MIVKRKVSDKSRMHNKIFLRNPLNDAFDTHELCKTIISLRLHKIYGNDIEFLTTEFKLDNGDLVDVYVELKNGDIIVYEIQKEINKKWTDKILARDFDMGIDTKVIPIKKIEEKIGDITWIDKYL